jgi:hypothetical protein
MFALALLTACRSGADAGCHDEPAPTGDLRPGSREELLELERYTVIQGGIAVSDIGGLDDLTEVPLFACLESAEFLLVEETSLRTLEGLEGLRELDHLYVVDNPRLVSLEALSGLQVVNRGVEIDGNATLMTIGLNTLTQVPRVTIGSAVRSQPGTVPRECTRGGNPSLVEIDGLQSLRGFEQIEVLGNTSLASVEAFRRLSVQADLVALPEATPNEDAPYVRFFGNNSLSTAHLDDVWSGAQPGGAKLFACDNKDDPCDCETWRD